MVVSDKERVRVVVLKVIISFCFRNDWELDVVVVVQKVWSFVATHCNLFPVLPTGYAWTPGIAPAISVN